MELLKIGDDAPGFECIDNNDIIAPLDCKEAVNKYGCDYEAHHLPTNKMVNNFDLMLHNICCSTCILYSGINLYFGDYYIEEETHYININYSTDTPIAGYQLELDGLSIKLNGIGKDLEKLSLETVQEFLSDAKKANYKIDINSK